MPNGPRHHYSFKRMERDEELRKRIREHVSGLPASLLFSAQEWRYAHGKSLDDEAEKYGLQRRIVEDQA